MPIGPKIPYWVKIRIAQLREDMLAQEPKTNAAMVGEAIRSELRRRNPTTPEGWPSDSAVRKIIADIRKREQEKGPSPDDRPWSLAALSFCDIPHEALPGIVRTWALRLAEGRPLTIRQAKWIGRMRHLWSNDVLLRAAADYCADLERALQMSDDYPSDREELRWLWVIDYLAYLEQLGGIEARRMRSIPRTLEQELWPNATEFWSAYHGRRLSTQEKEEFCATLGDALGLYQGSRNTNYNPLIAAMFDALIARSNPGCEITEEMIEEWKNVTEHREPDFDE